MAPLVEAFHPSQLQSRVQSKPDGKKRKSTVDLKQCELRELIQYACDTRGDPHARDSRVFCDPVLRLFRQCADGLTVETTRWENVHDRTR